MKRNDITRRQALLAGAALAVPLAGCAAPLGDAPEEGAEGAPETDGSADSAVTAASSKTKQKRPASTKGVVVEVTHPGVMVNGQPNATAVRTMVTRGMLALTKAHSETAAWTRFFTPADVVGIKVSPVGYPEAYSHTATLLEIIRGLNLAGVTNERIIVFDRYKDYLDAMGLPALLPSGVRFMGIVPTYTEDQTGTTGYDPAEYVDLPRVHDGDDPNDPQKRRTCLSMIVSKVVTKVINVPALKDHISAGITFALKNMTYGCVNNVSRTHQAPDNWTRDFVPAVAAMKKIRDKVVLHVGDALVATYDGGPGPPDANFKTFERASLFFATDPVALDRVGWKILDGERAKMGLPALANTGTLLTNPGLEAFGQRQPQHVLTAGAAGLGVSDLAAIDHRRITV